MNRPWMPWYVADFVADTLHLSAAETGAYMLLIGHYWQHGSLPDDERALSRICRMSLAEWRKSRAVIAGFFDDGWKHGRIDDELARAEQISSKRSASAKQRRNISSANAPANAEQKQTHARASPQSQSQPQKKDSGADAPDAGASDDPRMRLFQDGLKTLARLTGKGPDACRSFVGKCLKAAGDDAVTVLGLIEDAERNRAVDPTAWITARLKSPENSHGRRTVHDAANDLLARVKALDEPAPGGLRDREGEGAVRLLSPRRGE